MSKTENSTPNRGAKLTNTDVRDGPICLTDKLYNVFASAAAKIPKYANLHNDP